MKEGKVDYLHMIQESISRMPTNSAIFKGFAATIVAGAAALSYNSLNYLVLGLSFLPVLSFAVLDVYYLMLERRFRQLYDSVRNDKHPLDFSMELSPEPTEIRKANVRVLDCLKSPGIYLFYPLMLNPGNRILFLTTRSILMAKRQVFFSFRFVYDSWRAGQIRNMGKVSDDSTFSDSDWEIA